LISTATGFAIESVLGSDGPSHYNRETFQHGVSKWQIYISHRLYKILGTVKLLGKVAHDQGHQGRSCLCTGAGLASAKGGALQDCLEMLSYSCPPGNKVLLIGTGVAGLSRGEVPEKKRLPKTTLNCLEDGWDR